MSTRKPQAKEEVSRANDFHSLGLAKHLVEALERSEIKSPTKIQAESIPVLMQGKDLIAQAKTGSGKTLAFALPALDKIKNQKSTHTLVLTPTRELAQQVTNVFKQYSRQTKINIACVVGKESYTSQIESIRKGAQVVVATPGRLLDLLETKKINKFSPETVVFDEADEMLNMGFIDDIKSILKFIPEKRQTVFFSATFPQAIIKLAKMEQVNPISIRMDNEREKSSPLIEQHFFVIKNEEKKNAIIRLFEMNNPHKAIIFCRTKGDTEVLQNHFINKNFKAKALHGDLSQQDRKRAVNNFKDGSYNILIATDIASRGLDIDDLSHVFNYDLPENYDRYTHRIGRTGRAGKKGEAFTFTTKSEWRSNSFLRHVDMKNIKLAEIPNKEKVEKITLLKDFPL